MEIMDFQKAIVQGICWKAFKSSPSFFPCDPMVNQLKVSGQLQKARDLDEL